MCAQEIPVPLEKYLHDFATITSSARVTSHLDGVAVDHHEYDAAGVCDAADAEVQDVVLHAGGQDEGLYPTRRQHFS